MQDLTGKYRPALVPTSQEGGNLIQADLGKAAMTAPGSVPVTPLPSSYAGQDNLPGPVPSNSTPIPVSWPPRQPRLGAGDRGGSWQETPDTDDQPKPSPAWKQL